MVIYMNDLTIFSKNEKSHIQHFITVLSRHKDHKLYVSAKKCEFKRSEISFSERSSGTKESKPILEKLQD